MTSPPRHLMIVAGEVSGDQHAAELVRHLKQLAPTLTFSGLGGPKMRDAGVNIDEDLTRFAVVGFFEVLKHYLDFKRCFDLFLAKVRERKPQAVILVDYPGFNLRLAAELKKMGIPVIYYISPQVWAWKENRVQAIKRDISHMMVLFDFEKTFYAQRGYDADFVGNPLVDEVSVKTSREDILRALSLSTERITIGLLPGSRDKEVSRLLPVMIETAGLLHQRHPDWQFVIMRSSNLPAALFEKFLTKQDLPLKIHNGNFHDGVNACDTVMAASGTATLETALLSKPMVVVYKTSWPTYWLVRAMIKIPFISLVNIVAEKRIVPECLQENATGENIAFEIEKITLPLPGRDRMIRDLSGIREKLGAGGASLRAAQSILQFLDRSGS